MHNGFRQEFNSSSSSVFSRGFWAGAVTIALLYLVFSNAGDELEKRMESQKKDKKENVTTHQRVQHQR